jgi:hypothetical protein
MRTHVKVLGGLQLISGGFSLLLAFGGGMLFGFLGSYVAGSGDPDAATGSAVLHMLGAAAAFYFGLCAAVGIACGIGLLKHQPWARIVGIIFSALSLLQFPWGTALGVYGLWVLFNKETVALFEPGAGVRTQAPSA